MNRKLRKALREIYASEQPDNIPEFIDQIQKERNRRMLRFAAPATALLMIAFIGGYSYMNLHRIDRQPSAKLTEEIESTEPELIPDTEYYPSEIIPETERIIPEPELIPDTEYYSSESETETEMLETTITTTITMQIETVLELPAEQSPEEVITESEPELIICYDTEPETNYKIKSYESLDAVQDAYFYLQYQILEASDRGDGEAMSNFSDQADNLILEREEYYRDNGNPYYEHYKQIEEEIYNANYGYPADVYVNPVAQWGVIQQGYEEFMEQLLIDLKATCSAEESRQIETSQQNFLQKQQEIHQSDQFPNADYGWVREAQFVQYRVLLLMGYFQ